MRDLETMRSRNLALGGTLDNAIVLGETGVLNNALRFDDLMGSRVMIASDPPDHTLLRRVVSRPFTKRRIAEFRVSPDNLIEVGATITADAGAIQLDALTDAAAGDTLSLYFSYVSTDGKGFDDYAWARLVTADSGATGVGVA